MESNNCRNNLIEFHKMNTVLKLGKIYSKPQKKVFWFIFRSINKIIRIPNSILKPFFLLLRPSKINNFKSSQLNRNFEDHGFWYG